MEGAPAKVRGKYGKEEIGKRVELDVDGRRTAEHTGDIIAGVKLGAEDEIVRVLEGFDWVFSDWLQLALTVKKENLGCYKI